MAQSGSTSSFAISNACPRCGGSSASPFVTAGVCLRCAGERVLALDLAAEEAVSGAGKETTASPAFTDDLPLRIGPYEILEEVGRGGMGRVFVARQEGLDRLVAVKALPEGRGGAAGLELRFLREAQTAARLRHPHIVSVHESGRADGQVYFSMDYIDGGDLAQWLRQRSFTPRESAILVKKIADALAYTHAEGVLHRDVKPSNILLDGEEPRLADFGLAAQLEPGGDLTTATGVLGTPHYVAPEALREGSVALTTGSDLYALGVVLYEMLTGRVPYAGASPVELLRLIEHAEPPPPRLLAPVVPRDLETICLKCLEREPAQRYMSAAALAEDLRRFLMDEPILARAPGKLAALRKFSRRHRVVLTAAGATALVLVVATIVSTTQAVRARQAERQAATEAATARELADFLEKDLLGQATAGAQPDRTTTVYAMLERASKRIDGRFPSQPLVEAEVHAVIGNVYDSLGDYETGIRHLERAVDMRTKQIGAEHPLTLKATSELGSLLHDRGKLAESEKILARCMALQSRVLGPTHPDTLATVHIRAVNLRDFGKDAEADALLTGTLAVARAKGNVAPANLVGLLRTLGSIRVVQTRLPEAEALLREAGAIQAKMLGPDSLEVLTTFNDLAIVYREEGKLAQAAELNERVYASRKRQLGEEHPHTLISMNNLAGVYKAQRRLPEAEAMQEAALAIARRVQGADHPRTLITMRNLADTYRLEGRLEQSAALSEETLGLMRRVAGPTHPNTLTCEVGLGDVYITMGQPAKAEPLLREACEAYAKATSSAGWRADAARCQWGTALMQLGRSAEAEPLLVKGYEMMIAQQPKNPVLDGKFVTEIARRVVELYTNWGKPEQVAEWEKVVAGRAAR